MALQWPRYPPYLGLFYGRFSAVFIQLRVSKTYAISLIALEVVIQDRVRQGRRRRAYRDVLTACLENNFQIDIF